MTEQPTTPPESAPLRLPRLGYGIHWSDIVAEIDRDHRARKPEPEPDSTPSLGDPGSPLGVEAPVVDVSKPGFGIVSIAEARSWGIEPPPAVELLAMADDLNAHGGLDETFVAELLRQAADPYADAKRGLGIVDPPATKTEPTKPITYESIVEALEKVAPLGPTRLDVVKLTQEQIDAFPRSRMAAPSSEPWHYFGTPVELVETVEESTPYQLANARPGGIVEFRGDLTEAEFETLRADWLRAFDAKPHLSRWIVEADREFVDHVNDGVDRAAVLAAVKAEAERPPTHRHVWSMTSPVRCVECRRYLRPWWRRTLDRARRWGR